MNLHDLKKLSINKVKSFSRLKPQSKRLIKFKTIKNFKKELKNE